MKNYWIIFELLISIDKYLNYLKIQFFLSFKTSRNTGKDETIIGLMRLGNQIIS